MDINCKLNELLDKYEIEMISQTKRARRAEQIIIEIFSELIGKHTVAIRGGGLHTEKILSVLPIDIKRQIVCIFDQNPIVEKIDDVDVAPTKDLDEKDIDVIVISSYTYRKEIMCELLNADNNIRVIDLYDYFAIKGLVFDAPYYSGMDLDYRDIFIYRKLYEQEENNVQIKQSYLQWLIAAYIEIKDFYYAENYIREYIELKYRDYERYRQFLEELLELFVEIKEEIKYKNDILIHWVDALQFDEIEKMPFLNKMKGQSIFFENAYTQMPWTTMTMNVILSGKNVIDDKLYHMQHYDVNNCGLLKELTDNKCCFKYIGTKKIAERFPKDNIDYKICKDVPMVATNFWNALSVMANTSQRCCILLHHITETHRPFLNGYTRKYIADKSKYPVHKNLEEYEVNDYRNYEDGRNYIDIQLQWYEQFIADDMIDIYLSDHGKADRYPWSEKMMHVMFMLHNRNNVCPRIEKSLYSHADFGKIMENILKDSWELTLEHREFVRFQTLDAYSAEMVNWILRGCSSEERNQMLLENMQMRGIKNEKELFIVDILGNEYYFINNDYQSNLVNEECYSERVKYLRGKNGRDFIDVFSEPQFKESRRLYEAMGIYSFSSLKNKVNFVSYR